jgi:hypothetical protein
MNWTDFIKYTSILYFFYYALNILIDLLWPVKQKSLEEEDKVIRFAEEVQPIVVESAPAQEKPQTEEALSDEDEEQENTLWVRGKYDTEELVLREENITETTGGVFKVEELIAKAKTGTIVFKEQVVY